MFREIKRHVNKPDEVYACEFVKRGPGWVMLKYISRREWVIAGTLLPAGSVTLALYLDGSDWVLWRISSPDGLLLGHLFHVCADVDIGEAEVSYRDLLLDVWIGANGGMALLDEDEVAECTAAGTVTPEQAAAIVAAGARIGRCGKPWVAELDARYFADFGAISGRIDCR